MEEEYEVVISGMSGRLPNCDSVEELKHALFNNINLVSQEGKWDAGELNVPHQTGKITDPFVFDLTYFGISRKIAEYMDPSVKLILEAGVAALHDAGYSLKDIAGSNTASLVSSSLNETEYESFVNRRREQTLISHSVSMQANRLAYFMDLKGPSYVCDSGWNGGMYMLQTAKDLISRGSAKAAMVAVSSLLFTPQVSFHYNCLGRLNEDGKTKCFDDNVDGYSRSEACVVFFLQRKEDARRIYGTLLGVEVALNGSKTSALSDCSQADFSVMKRLYEKIKVDPASVSYLEASGCASKIVEANELNAVSDIFLGNRAKPLLIGSVKSNVGHTEAASSFLGLMKVLIAAETGTIPANLHYSTPNSLVPALISGSMKVVSEPTQLEGDILAVSNTTASGGYCHAVIKKNTKSKQRQCQVSVLPPDGIPRLVLLSGREKEGVKKIIAKVSTMPIDEEFVALTHKTFAQGIKRHVYRGYTILHDGTALYQDVEACPDGDHRPLWIIFAGMGSQWPGMGAELMRLPQFAKAINYCHSLLEPLGVNLIDIVTKPDPQTFDNILNCFVGIAAVQIGLVDVLKTVGLDCDGIIGHSLGELSCAYFDGSFTAEQMIMGAYYRGKISADSKMSDGRMAAVGEGYKKLHKMLPEGIDIACRNSSTSSTISGPADILDDFIEKLKAQGIFTKAVPSGGIAYHSRYIQVLGPQFQSSMEKLVPEPKLRSPKWISSSVPEKDWDKDFAKYSSAEYHTNNLLKPVLFEEAIAHIPKDAIVLEVSPRGLLKAIIQRAIPSVTYIPFVTKGKDCHTSVINAFGRLFIEGINFDIEKLYPKVEFPVSRGTPSLSHLFTWIHNESWTNWLFLKKPKEAYLVKDIEFNNDKKNKYNIFANYLLKNVPVVPVAAYLDIIIDAMKEVEKNPVSKVLLGNISFKRILKYGENNAVHVGIQEGSNSWEFSLSEYEDVASGKIIPFLQKTNDFLKPDHVPAKIFSQEMIYSFLKGLGVSVNETFKNIQSLTIDDCFSSISAEIIWNCDLLVFLDSVLMLLAFFYSFTLNRLNLVTRINQMFIDLDSFSLEENKIVKVYYNKIIDVLWTEGLEIHHPSVEEPNVKSLRVDKTDFLVPKFTPFERKKNTETFSEFIEACLLIVLNNVPSYEGNTKKLKVFPLSKDKSKLQELFEIFKKHDSKIAITPLPDDSALLYARAIKEGYCFVFNESNNLECSFKVIESSEGGFLLCCSKVASPTFACISKQRFGSAKYYLYKYVPPHRKDSASVLLTSPEWKSEIKSKLSEANDRLLYLVGYYTSLQRIHEIVQLCSSFQHSELLRFVFLEKPCSLFTPEKFKDQLKKDLRINIAKNGKWGTYVFCPAQVSNLELKQESGKSVYRFNEIKTNGLHLNALGLNVSDLPGQKGKLGVFEYSGIKDGTPVCGLGSLNENSLQLQVDTQLVWGKPEQWSDEDITTVLVPYSMAYYILLAAECYEHSIEDFLVHNGELPLAQAVIRLAVKKGFNVFTTYDGDSSKKDLIKHLLPEVPDGNIIRMDPCLHESILFKTNGKGVQIVVNTADKPEILKSTINALGYRSKFFQIKTADIGTTIGMYVFLKEVCWHGFGPESLLNLSSEEKQSVWKMVESGLRNGEIKPLNKIVISPLSMNVDAILQKKNENELVNKIVVNMSDECASKEKSNKQIFVCDANKPYVILGNENIIWFELIQWLVTRGCRHFIIIADSISEYLANRLNILLKENECVDANIYSLQKLQNSKRPSDLFQQIEQNGKIGTMFVFGKEFGKLITDVSQHLGGARVITIGRDVEVNWKDRFSHNPLAVDIQDHDCDLSSIIDNMDSLINIPEIVLYMSNSSVNVSGVNTSLLEIWNHLPDCTSSIIHLASSSGKADWKEVRTNSPPYHHCKDVPPVFVLPSLRKGQFDKLIQSLFYPAFEAVIPERFKSFEELAKDLYEALLRFDCGMITIICADWSYLLGLSLGQLLEQNGKVVSLVLLEINTSWANPEALNFIRLKSIKALEGEDEQLSSKKLEQFENGFEILKHRINHVLNSTMPTSPQIQGYCHVLLGDNTDEALLKKLFQLCQRPVKVHNIQKSDFLEMINSREVAEIVNTYSLVEHKDRARTVSRDYEPIYVYRTDLETYIEAYV